METKGKTRDKRQGKKKKLSQERGGQMQGERGRVRPGREIKRKTREEKVGEGNKKKHGEDQGGEGKEKERVRRREDRGREEIRQGYDQGEKEQSKARWRN